ncbi:MAG: hypothetical protein ACRC7R_01060 [Sarcina sp.]
MSSLLENFIIDIINKYSLFFLRKKNVTAIGLGYKKINKITSNELCIHVLVDKKLPLNKLYSYDIIPKKFLGIKTDVIECRKPTAFNINNDNQKLIHNLQSRVRPIQPGYSVGPYKHENAGGTIGAIVFNNDTDAPYIISNNHVLADANRVEDGAPILQPCVVDGGNVNSNVVALLSGILWLEASADPDTEIIDNYADAAIAEILPNIEYDKTIPIIGDISGTTEAKLGMKVRKVGRTTGYTEATIETLYAKTVLDFGLDGECFFADLVHCNYLSDHGDSGSIIIDFNNKVVGLLIGGDEEDTYFSPIDNILNAFNVHF